MVTLVLSLSGCWWPQEQVKSFTAKDQKYPADRNIYTYKYLTISMSLKIDYKAENNLYYKAIFWKDSIELLTMNAVYIMLLDENEMIIKTFNPKSTEYDAVCEQGIFIDESKEDSGVRCRGKFSIEEGEYRDISKATFKLSSK